MKTNITININWNSKLNIRLAKKQKTMLENKGYKLINNFGGHNHSVLIYSLEG